jgi:hypothetical protein
LTYPSKKMCDSSQNLRFPQSSPPEENHRAGLGRLRDESQSPRFCTILKERSLLRKTCQADKIFRETWSKSRTEANCPYGSGCWKIGCSGMAAGNIIFTVHFAWFQTKPCFRSEDSLKTSERRVATSPPQQRVKSRGNAQVARARARHASRAARRKDTQKVRETSNRAPVPTPHPSRPHGPRPS